MNGCCLWLLLCVIVPICFQQVESWRSGGNTCSQNTVKCDNGAECLPREKWCDGAVECADGSDEKFCKRKGWFDYSSVNSCSDKHFECDDGPCVPVATKCDGFKDCDDNSDERNCNNDEDKESESKEGTAKLPSSNIPDEDLDNDNASGNNDIVLGSVTSQGTETAFSPSYDPAPMIAVSQSSTEGYYDRIHRESRHYTTENYGYNGAQHSFPQNTYDQSSSHSQNYDRTKVYRETSYNGVSQTYGHNDNNSEGNIGSGYPNGYWVRLPPRVFPSSVPLSTSNIRYTRTHQDKEEHGDKQVRKVDAISRNSGAIIIKLPSRVFPLRFQPSISNSHGSDYQPSREDNFRTEHYDERNIPPVPIFSSTIEPSISNARDRYGQNGNVGNSISDNSNGIFVKLPSRVFPHTVRSSIPVHVTNGLNSNENVRSEFQRRTSTSSADSQAEIQSPIQYADYTDDKEYIQSDVSQPQSYVHLNTPFQFRTDYTYKFGNSYKSHVTNAEDWILNQRITSYGWKEDTPRALIALSLINNSFSLSVPENELMKKGLATHFGIQMLLMRDDPGILTNSSLASYINALLATCQDPKKFFNRDITKELRNKAYFGTDVNPFAYLTLCLTNTPVEFHELDKLNQLINKLDEDERTSDMRILAATALACFHHQDQYKRYLEGNVQKAFVKLLETRLPDGSFGSIYSTALAAQALMSMDVYDWGDAKKTMDFLIKHQEPDGSFGDMLATYLIVPALRGRSLLHLRNTRCDPVKPKQDTSSKPSEYDSVPPGVPMIGVYYTIKVGYPESSTITTYLDIPRGSNFSYAMGKAEHLNSQFRFLYKKLDNGYRDVHTIIDIPNDTELGFRWKLYVVNPTGQEVTLNLQEWYAGDVTELIPEDGQEFIYWYLPIFL